MKMAKSLKEVMQTKNQQTENPEITSLRAQVLALQEQLTQGKQDQETKKLEDEARKLAEHEEALKREADVKSVLSESFDPKKLGIDPSKEDLDQRDLVNILADGVDRAAKAQQDLILSKVAEMLKETNESVDGTKKAMMELIGHLHVNKAREEYPDFDEYKDDVRGILSKTAGLTPEEAYLLAKARAAKNQPTKRQAESERPSFPGLIPNPNPQQEEEEEEEPTGSERRLVSPKKAFADAVSKAIDKVRAAKEK